MRHVDFDPVGAMIKLFARRFSRFDRPINNLHSLRHLQFRCIAFEVVSASGRNSTCRHKQARAGNCAFRDRLFDSDVAVACAFGFDVAQRRESLLESPAAGNGRARRSQRNTRLQNVCVVSALGRIFAPQKNMRVRVNHSRQHCGGGKIDDVCPGRNCRGSLRDFLNAFAANKYQLIFANRVARTIKQCTCTNYGKSVCRCSGGRRLPHNAKRRQY